MFEKIKKYVKFIKEMKQHQDIAHESNDYVENDSTIYMEIDINLKNLKRILGKSSDIIFREFKIGAKEKIKAFICVVDFLVDKDKVEGYIKTMSMFDKSIVNDDSTMDYSDIFTTLKEKLLYSIDIKESGSFNEVLENILSGSTVIFIDGYNTAFIIGAQYPEA